MQVPSAVEDTFSLVIFASKKENNNDRSLGKYYNILFKKSRKRIFFIADKKVEISANAKISTFLFALSPANNYAKPYQSYPLFVLSTYRT